VFTRSCLLTADGNAPAFDSTGNEILPSDTQAIVVTYKFQATVDITKWETYVDPPHKKGVYIIHFQVWRPVGLQEHGCYTQIGSNTFSGSLKKKGRVDFKVDPSNYITAEAGDVVGLFVSSRNGGQEGVRLYRSTQTENIVWYNSASNLFLVTNQCPFPVGPTGILTNRTSAAPMLRVSTGKPLTN